MKILLINPPYAKGAVGFEHLMTIEPLALEYLGAILKKDGHKIRLLDAVLDDGLEDMLRDFHPDVVSMTCIYNHMYVVKRICRTIKCFDPHITTIVAGSHAVLYPHEYYMKGVDIINCGEDLLVASKLMRGIESGDLSDVEGIHYRTSNGWKVGKPTTRCVSIDELPFPDRTLTQKYRKHYYWYFEKEIATVWGSVGCPFKCYYCTQWSKNGGKYVSRSPESLVEEIKSIKQDAVFIIDDNTFLNPQRLARIIELIKKNNIHKKYMCYCSANLVIKHEGLIREWKKYGLSKLMIGFESFREKDLKDLKRKTGIETNNKAISILHDIGIDTMAGFIIYPDFTKDDFKALRNYVKQQKLYYIEFTSLTPFPGTVFYEQSKNEVSSFNPELYDMQHMLFKTALPLKEYYRQIALSYLSSYWPHRAIAAHLNFKLSLNPFDPIYRSFVRFLWKTMRAYKDHEIVMPELKTDGYSLPHPAEQKRMCEICKSVK